MYSGLKLLAAVCALIALFTIETLAANKQGVAVIIGNKTYGGRIPAVEFAHNDATAMKKFVINSLGYRPGNIIDLRDATKGQIEAVFGSKESHKGRLFNWLRPGKSDVTVFYSGHGVPGLRDRRGYLLPVDGDPNLAELTGYPVDQLYENLSKLPARSVTVFLDACFSGDSPKGMLVQASSGISVNPRALKTTKGMTILTAAQGDQLASWDETAKHGLFTRHLLLALGGKADGTEYGNGDGKVTLAETKKYLDEEMSYQARRRFGREQTASMQGVPEIVLASYTPGQVLPSLQVEEVDASYVALKTANVRSEPSSKSQKVGRIPKDAGVTVTGTVAGGKWLRVEHSDGKRGFVFGSLLAPVDSGEVVAWSKVKDSKSADEVVAFLRSYPSGHFSGRAKALQAALTPRVAAITPPKVTVPSPSTPVVGIYLSDSKAGDVFKDCDECPEMVVIPRGHFRMGDLSGEGDSDEKPIHDVLLDYRFAIGKYEVTRGEYELFVSETDRLSGDGCFYHDVKWKKDSSRNWRNPGFYQGKRAPVVCVGWYDAKAYVRWLTEKTGETYRLLSESEWEYVARAGTGTKYSFGNYIGSGDANYAKNIGRSRSVGSYSANGFGIHDMHGNVLEWVEDCWHDSYQGAPVDGSTWGRGGNCKKRVLRGGSWLRLPVRLRAANRNWDVSDDQDDRNYDYGFRIARTLSR